MKKIIFLVAMLVIGISSYAAVNSYNNSVAFNYYNEEIKTTNNDVQCTYKVHENFPIPGFPGRTVHIEFYRTETTSILDCFIKKALSAVQDLIEAARTIADIFINPARF